MLLGMLHMPVNLNYFSSGLNNFVISIFLVRMWDERLLGKHEFPPLSNIWFFYLFWRQRRWSSLYEKIVIWVPPFQSRHGVSRPVLSPRFIIDLKNDVSFLPKTLKVNRSLYSSYELCWNLTSLEKLGWYILIIFLLGARRPLTTEFIIDLIIDYLLERSDFDHWLVYIWQGI